MTNRTARLELEIDGRSAKRGTSEAERELRELVRTARQVVGELNDLNRGMDRTGRGASEAAREMNRLERQTEQTGNAFVRGRVSAEGFTSSLVAFRNAAIVVLALDMGRRFLEIADSAKQMEAQLRLATPATVAFADAQADVRRIAAETRIGIEATNELYSKFSRMSGDLGLSQLEAARATETFAKTLKISGASTAEADAVTRQFGQALASGVLRGDEFNSVMEASPRLSRLLAESLGKPVGALREMAEEGELTADKLTKALTDAKFTEGIDKEFRALPVTFSEAMTLVQDAAVTTFGAFDRGGRFSEAIVDFVLGGVSGMGDLAASAEQTGIDIRSSFEALHDVFAPMLDGALEVFGTIETKSKELSGHIADLLGLIDDIGNAGNSPDAWFQNLANKIPGRARLLEMQGMDPYDEQASSRGPSLRERFETSQADREAKLQADRRDREFRDSQPDRLNFDYTTPNSGKTLSDMINGTGAFAQKARPTIGGDDDDDKKKTKATPPRTNQQIFNDFKRELAAEGILQNRGDLTGFRTQAQQDSLFAQGKTNARVSRHQSWEGLDVPIGADADAIRAAATRAGVKDLRIIREPGAKGGAHSHLQWNGAGKPGDTSDLERQADLEQQRLDRTQAYFESLKQQVELSKLMPQQAAQLNDELKLRAIINQGIAENDREISDGQKTAIADARKQIAANELNRDIKIAVKDAEHESIRLAEQAKALSESTVDTEEANLAVQERLWPYKLQALKDGLDLNDATLKSNLAELETIERQNLALEKKNQQIAEGVRIADSYKTPAMVQADDLKQLGKDREALDAAKAAGRLSDEVYKAAVKGLDQAVWETSHRFELEFADSIVSLASMFKGKLGDAANSFAKVLAVMSAQSRGDFSQSGAIGGIIGLFNGPNGNRVAESATKASQDQWSNIFKGDFGKLSDGFKSFQGDLKNIFGKGGDFQAGLGSVLGKAGMGAQMGSAADDIMGMLGIKSSKTGAQVGGAVGNAAFGPIGGIAGSILGGLVGGLFKKTPKGYSVITGGDEGDFSVSGNKKGIRENLTSVSSGLQGALADIAEQLGVDVGGFRVSVGQYKDQYRVSASGSSSVGSKKFTKKAGSDLLYAGDDPEAAMRAALQNAISDGALSGLSPTINRVITMAGKDIEKGLSDALKLKSIKDELQSIEDPMNYALESLNKGFTEIFDLLRKAGGTSQEFADAEKLYQLKREEIIEQGNNASLKQMREYLFQLTGGTSSPLSPESRYSTASAELAGLDAKRASGGKVDFADYQSVADAFLAASRDANGSTLKYFADLKKVTDTVQAMIDEQGGVKVPEIDFSPVVNAVDAQTQALLAALAALGGTTPPAPPASGGSYDPSYNIAGSGGRLLSERYLDLR